MRTMRWLVVALLGTFTLPSQAATIGEIVIDGCNKELETYCKDVKPGEGRLAACLYAHSDKVSNQCTFALYDAMNQLERFVAALRYVATECEVDIEKHCANVEPGEGRIIKCLLDKGDGVSKGCNQALTDVGAK